MNGFQHLRNAKIFLVFVLCLTGFSSLLVEAAIIPVSVETEDSRLEASTGREVTATVNDGETESIPSLEYDVGEAKRNADESNAEKSVNVTKKNVEESLNELFNPFLTFPFFPFRFPSLKRDIFRLNSTEKESPADRNARSPSVNRSDHKAKPFLFIDFAFNIREIPVKNQTNEAKPPRADAAAKSPPKRNGEKSDGLIPVDNSLPKDLPLEILDDDWSFFDDSPLMPPEMEEFLPKSDFLFFDFPFHRKQSKKLVRSKRDMTKPVVDSDINFIMDIFDEAISQTKKEMEQTVPLWDLISEAAKHPEEKREKGSFPDKFHPGDEGNVHLKDMEKHRFDKSGLKGVKRSPYDSVHHKNPVILGKVVKIGEIHFGDDYAKNKKKRRIPGLGKKGNRGIEETSIELIQMDEPLRPELAPKQLEFLVPHPSLKDIFHRIQRQNLQDKEHRGKSEANSVKMSRGTQDAKILELLANWDRREMEEQADAKTAKGQVAEPYTKKDSGAGASHLRLSGGSEILQVQRAAEDEGFKYVDHMPNGRSPKGSVGFEVLQPHLSFQRPKRQESGGLVIQEKVTASKDEVRKNITHVLGQFFSMIKKLGDSKSFYQDKESPEVEDVNWPELDDGSGSYIKERLRRTRDSEPQEGKGHQVADLNYLFLTVTLPTMFAFTLMLVVCFFNLRVRGWLCTKLFKPRNVYVVEGDVEKGRLGLLGLTTEGRRHCVQKEPEKEAQNFGKHSSEKNKEAS